VSITKHNDVSKDETPARRLEIFTGAGRRRIWTAEDKASIVAESYEHGVRVSHVARRHGLTPQQLFGWRREARRRSDDMVATPAFAPVIFDAANGVSLRDVGGKTPEIVTSSHSIELDVKGSRVWIWPGADPAMVTTIIGALKVGK
jgi:transposase